MALTASEILKAKLPDGQTLIKLYDREHKSDRAGVAGLFLLVTKSGSKLWKLQYRINGKRTEISLGAFTATTAAEAKAALEQARKEAENIRNNKIAKGIDPVVKIDSTGTDEANTFKAVALQWHDWWSAGVDGDTSTYILRRLESDVFPALGHKQPDDIKPADVRNLILAIESGKGEARRFAGKGARDVAQRQHGTISQIFRYAVTHDLATTNPAATFKPSDVLKPRKTQHRAHIEPNELPALLVAIDDYQDAKLIRRLAMKLMTLTFVRTGELLQAPWSEFGNLDNEHPQWEIPKERMKMDRPHIVPLSHQAVAILKQLQWIAGDKKFVFNGLNKQTENGTINENSILDALDEIGFGGVMTGHGFRGLARTILAKNGFDKDVCNLQLAHAKDKEDASYNHWDYLDKRIELMQWWADHLDEQLAKGRKALAA